jgi:hypothetical protein
MRFKDALQRKAKSAISGQWSATGIYTLAVSTACATRSIVASSKCLPIT